MTSTQEDLNGSMCLQWTTAYRELRIRYLSAQSVEHIERRERWLAQRLMAQLRAQPRLEVFASPDPACQTAVLSVRCRDMDCETLAQALAHSGIAVRAGLHCAPLAHRTAGTEDTGTVLLSLSFYSTARQLEQAADKVCRLVKKL